MTLSFVLLYQVTAVTFIDTAEQVLSGGIDNDIKVCTVISSNSSDLQ